MSFSILIMLLAAVLMYIEYNGVKGLIKMAPLTKPQFYSIAANSLFLLILITFIPLYATWEYMRINDFFAPEILINTEILKYISLEYLIYLLYILFIINLPLIAVYLEREISATKTPNDNEFEKALWKLWKLVWIISTPISVYFIYIFSIYIILFLLLIFAYVFIRFSPVISSNNNTFKSIKSNKLYNSLLTSCKNYGHFLILTLSILIISLFSCNGFVNTIVGNAFHVTKLGNIDNVIIQINEKQEINGCLLLKTQNFYYLKTKNNEIKTINTEGSVLTYNSEKHSKCQLNYPTN